MRTTRTIILAMALALGVGAALAGPAASADNGVDGFGRDRAAAERVAQDNAREQLKQLLRERLGPGWQPSDTRLDPGHLLKEGVLVPAGVNEVDVDGHAMYRARFQVELPGSFLDSLQDDAGRQRVEDRRWLALRGLAGLVALLGLVYGYLRLESLTRGYYTQALRVGVAVLALLAATGLWFSL